MSNDINFEDIDRELIQLHNQVRKDPTILIDPLEKLLSHFRGDVIYVPGEVPYQTNEGPDAVREAIEFVRNQQPLHELKYDENLTKSARDHLLDIGPKGLLSHDGSDGSTVSDRIERHCEWETTCAENIDFGGSKAMDFLLLLVVDDGCSDRGHRKNIFSDRVYYFGLASGRHAQYETCLVINYAGGVRDKNKPYHDFNNLKFQFPDDLSVIPKKKKPKNSYQLDDEDAPDDTVAVKVIKQTKLYNGKVHRVTKKIYTLSNGGTMIVEVEDK